MSNEAQLLMSLIITKADETGNVNYQSYPTQFVADVSGAMGPTPGAFPVTIYGTDVDFSKLTTPGLCKITNLDNTNYVSYGMCDTDTNKYYPMGELLAGEFFILRLARDLGAEYAASGTGTGTTASSNNTMRFVADTASCNVLVEAFEA